MDKSCEYQFFPPKIFCLSAKKRRRDPFSVSLNSGIEKVWMGGWGECQDFPLNLFCLTMSKNFVEQPFRVSLISGIKKIYASEGYVTISVEIFCLTKPKYFVGELCVLHFFRVSKKFGREGGGGGAMSIFSVENFLSHSAEKRRRGNI